MRHASSIRSLHGHRVRGSHVRDTMRSKERAQNVGPSFRQLLHVAIIGSRSIHTYTSLPATNCVSLADFIRLIRASRYRNYGRGNASRNPCKSEKLRRHPPPPFQFFSPSPPLFLSILCPLPFSFSRVSLSTVTDLHVSRQCNVIPITFRSDFREFEAVQIQSSPAPSENRGWSDARALLCHSDAVGII